MFTGIVEELGTVVSREGPRLRIGATTVLDDVTLGASIAVNGCCLTVVGWDAGEGWWEADVVDETYARTALGSQAPGTASTSNGPCGSATGSAATSCRATSTASARSSPAPPTCASACDRPPALRRREGLDHRRRHQPHGRRAVLDDGFTVAVIPHTIEVTTLGHKGPGDLVNLEVDVTAKYVERLLSWKDA